MRILISSIFLVLLCGTSIQAQKTTNFNSWYSFSGNHGIGKKTSLHTLYSIRRNDFIKNSQQSLLRLGLNYSLLSNLKVMAGYDYAVTYPYGEQPIARRTTEHRAIFQAVVTGNLKNTKLTNQYKIEQRFIRTDQGTLSRQRLRYKLVAEIPLHKNADGFQNFSLVLYNELFVNVGNEVNDHYFDQNWLYGGFKYKFNPSMALSVGYFNQYIQKGDNVRIESNHTLAVTLSKNFDFKKKS